MWLHQFHTRFQSLPGRQFAFLSAGYLIRVLMIFCDLQGALNHVSNGSLVSQQSLER